MEILQLILKNPVNSNVLKFLGVNPEDNSVRMEVYSEEKIYHEGLDDFLTLHAFNETKFILNGHGIMCDPVSGEIFAIQTGRSNIFLKLPDKNYTGNLSRLKLTHLRSGKFKNLFKLKLNYWSNIYGDDVIDAGLLGDEWAVHLYFIDRYGELIYAYYEKILSNNEKLKNAHAGRPNFTARGNDAGKK